MFHVEQLNYKTTPKRSSSLFHVEHGYRDPITQQQGMFHV